jgi:CheY-like chemotaxis protein
MLTYAVPQSVSDCNSNGGRAPVKVLLVSDWIENLPRVKSALRLAQHQVTYAQTAADLNRACQDFYDFVVVDVGPEHIVYALRELRASAQLQNSPVLVRAERLAQAFELTSVFAKYRAMPGLDVELAKLVSACAQEKRSVGTRDSNELPPGHSLL